MLLLVSPTGGQNGLLKAQALHSGAYDTDACFETTDQPPLKEQEMAHSGTWLALQILEIPHLSTVSHCS